MRTETFSAPRRAVRLGLAIALLMLAGPVAGCGGSDVQTTPTSLEKPPLAVPSGSLAASSAKKTEPTGVTSTTTTDSGGADTGDVDTGGADTGGAGTDTGGGGGGGDDGGGGGGGADTGGAAPGN